MKLKSKVFNLINHVRLYKKVIIPVEIMEARGLRTTECYNEIIAKCMLKWDIEFPLVKKPKIKEKREQDKFKKQLKTIEISTVYNFQIKTKSELQVSNCK